MRWGSFFTHILPVCIKSSEEYQTLNTRPVNSFFSVHLEALDQLAFLPKKLFLKNFNIMKTFRIITITLLWTKHLEYKLYRRVVQIRRKWALNGMTWALQLDKPQNFFCQSTSNSIPYKKYESLEIKKRKRTKAEHFFESR